MVSGSAAYLKGLFRENTLQSNLVITIFIQSQEKLKFPMKHFFQHSISLYNEDHEDFVAGFNANMKNIFTDPPLVFTLTNNKRQLKMELKRGFDWIITPEEGNQLLRVLGLDPNKNLKIRHKPEGFTVVRRYQAPNRDVFKNQTIRWIAKEPVLDETFEIKLEEGDVVEQIDAK
ncbi:uncharacterized protein TNCV_81111 [Trichonephila clavipes]|nr:uncharacterized protein TNCV_81111 [Trichonephila clavipes]